MLFRPHFIIEIDRFRINAQVDVFGVFLSKVDTSRREVTAKATAAKDLRKKIYGQIHSPSYNHKRIHGIE